MPKEPFLKMMSGQTIYSDMKVPNFFEKPSDKFVGINMFEQIRSIREIKDSDDEKLKFITNKWPEIKSLCAIPGISHIRATIIMALVCSGDRFPHNHKFWSYCCLVRHGEFNDGRVYGNK